VILTAFECWLQSAAQQADDVSLPKDRRGGQLCLFKRGGKNGR